MKMRNMLKSEAEYDVVLINLVPKYPWRWEDSCFNRCKLGVNADSELFCIWIFLVCILMNSLKCSK